MTPPQDPAKLLADHDIAWLKRVFANHVPGGHCGESTSDVIWRQREEEKAQRIIDALTVAQERVVARAYSEADVVAAAGNIFDCFSGGSDWRKRADISSIYESADWQAAMTYAKAALDARPAPPKPDIQGGERDGGAT